MKVFLIIYLFGDMAMTMGPLPYSVIECNVQAKDMLDSVDYSKTPTYKGRTVDRSSFTFQCVQQDTRPAFPPGAKVTPLFK